MNTIGTDVVYFNVNFNLLVKPLTQHKNALTLYTANYINTVISLFLLVRELLVTFNVLGKALD